ncbi:MAG TPA: hypothetical protein VFD92_20660 [Candidatus Binatia bacterium]|nr:hypothetical protein [Candidatus Binatia bacterium]
MQAMDFHERLERSALQARARPTLLALLDRLAEELADRRAAEREVAAVLRALRRCWSSASVEPASPLGSLVALVESAGPRLPLRELAERCERLAIGNGPPPSQASSGRREERERPSHRGAPAARQHLAV